MAILQSKQGMVPKCMSLFFLPAPASLTQTTSASQAPRHRTRVAVLVRTCFTQRRIAFPPTSVRLPVETDQVLAPTSLKRNCMRSCSTSWARRGRSSRSSLLHQPQAAACHQGSQNIGPTDTLTALILTASRFPPKTTGTRRPSHLTSPETVPIISTRGSWRKRRAVLTSSSVRAWVQAHLQTMAFSGPNSVLADISHRLGTSLWRLLRRPMMRDRLTVARSREISSRRSGRGHLDLRPFCRHNPANLPHHRRGPSARLRGGLSG